MSLPSAVAEISAFGPARSTVSNPTLLDARELAVTDAYWRASLYMCTGMIYLRDNPLLRRPLKPEDLKQQLLGHWGSDPAMSLVYIHMNRLIKKLNLNVIFIAGPGHGAPAVLSNAYLEGTYSEIYPDCGEDEEGLCRFFRRFSLPEWNRKPLYARDPWVDPRGR
jgi:xylulose-5-phosphate/fructose-6-phosphate phosphoketolase